VSGNEAATASAPDGHLVWKTIRVEGRRAQYGVAGEGMPVLFLHGWAMAHHTYKRTLKRLVLQGCQVLAPAMPGFGGTPNLPFGRVSYAGYAEWTANFLDAVGVDEPAIVIGHSFGGGVAIALAHDHPDTVGELVLINSVGGAWRTADGRERLMRERPLWDWAWKWAADLLPSRDLPKLVPILLEDLVPNLIFNPIGVARTGALACSADLRAELAAIKQRRLPVVAISGDHDLVIPSSSFEALCEALGCAGEVVPGRHSWLLADPEGFEHILTRTVLGMRSGRTRKRLAAS
jgi:pimeloyl-ACP methyl ester carboxylesterase